MILAINGNKIIIKVMGPKGLLGTGVVGGMFGAGMYKI